MGAFRAIGADHGVRWDIDHIAALVDRKAERLEELEREGGTLFPGAAEAVGRAAAAVPIAIASGALRAEIVRVLERGRAGEVVRGDRRGRGHARVSKPAPDPYQRAVALLGEATGLAIAPGECVAIEDSHWGLESARAAGLRTVAVAQSYPAATLVSADLVIGTIAELDIDRLRRLTS